MCSHKKEQLYLRNPLKIVITQSTMESKFIPLDKCGEKVEWLGNFLEDIPKWPKHVPAIYIHSDSQLVNGKAQSNMHNGKSRHVCQRHNSIRQLIYIRDIFVHYEKLKDN